VKTHWLETRETYDGSALRAHWILHATGIAGDAMVGFRGPCAVSREEMADLADLDGPGIAADDMVHFVWECFSAPDLLLAVHRQRLLAAIARDVILEMAPAARLRRLGDDLFAGDGKLSISIATVTPVSSVLHFAVNATNGGAPVPTASLADLGVPPAEFGVRLLAATTAEVESIALARAKVRPKGEWPR
jgi:hypothetical protein